MVLIAPGSEADKQSISLGTRKTRYIRNEVRDEWDPDQLQDGLDRCLRDFPNLIVRSVTATYNCVGMVFASRRTVVDEEFVPQLLTDDGYRPLPDISTAMVGDVVVYKKASGDIGHVGIIINRIENVKEATVAFKILSKWGPYAEFFHDPSDVYESWGTLAEVWTDRK